MVKKGNRSIREPVTVEHLRLEQIELSRVTILEAYLEAWQQPSHVCGVIRDRILERCMDEQGMSGENSLGAALSDAAGSSGTGAAGVWENQAPLTPEEDSDGVNFLPAAGGGYPWPVQRKAMGLRQRHRCLPDYQAWDRSFQRYLQSRQLVQEWLRVWRIPVYAKNDIAQQLQTMIKWVKGWQRLSQILVLGYDSDMLVCLPQLMRHARGIHFYLDYEPKGMGEIQDWIYEEYGLVTKWQVLESGEWTRTEVKTYLRSYQTPCLVIDLTGTENIPVTGLLPGSMWWDLGAMEEKRHLLEDRPLGVEYFSQKTLWRDLQAKSQQSRW